MHVYVHPLERVYRDYSWLPFTGPMGEEMQGKVIVCTLRSHTYVYLVYTGHRPHGEPWDEVRAYPVWYNPDTQHYRGLSGWSR